MPTPDRCRSPTEFFDAIVSIDSFIYYGTDDLYLNYLARFVKPGGAIGIAGAGLIREIDGPLPAHLQAWWTHDLWCLHSAAWWRRHWERTGIVDIEVADTLADGWRLLAGLAQGDRAGQRGRDPGARGGSGPHLGYVRVVGRRRPGIDLGEHVTSVAAKYVPAPLLRETEGATREARGRSLRRADDPEAEVRALLVGGERRAGRGRAHARAGEPASAAEHASVAVRRAGRVDVVALGVVVAPTVGTTARRCRACRPGPSGSTGTSPTGEVTA